MTPGGNITPKKISGALKKQSKSRDYQERSLSKSMVKEVKGKGTKVNQVKKMKMSF